MKRPGLAALLCCIVLCAAQVEAGIDKVQSVRLGEAIQMALEHNS